MSESTTAAPAEAAAPATDTTFKVGQQVKFKDYAPGTPDDQKVFKPGDILEVVSVQPKNSPDDIEGYEVSRPVDGVKSSAYFDELESYTPEEKKKGGKAKLTDEEKAAAAKKKEEEKAAKAAAKEAERLAKEEANKPAPLVLTEAVKGLVDESDPLKTLEATKELNSQTEQNSFTLGGLMEVVNRGSLQAQILVEKRNEAGEVEVDASGAAIMVPKYTADLKGFQEFVEQELGIAYRKAMYLIKNYVTYSALGVDEQKIKEVGWTKLMLLVPVVNKDNVEELLDNAKNQSKSEVEKVVKEKQVAAGTSTTPRAVAVVIKGTFYNDQGQAIKAIVDAQAAVEPGDKEADKYNAALATIITEWNILKQGVEQASGADLEQSVGQTEQVQEEAAEQAAEQTAAA